VICHISFHFNVFTYKLSNNACFVVVQSTSWSPVTNIVQKHITIVFQVNAVLNAADPLLKNDVANQV
jgi:hypothetical protein